MEKGPCKGIQKFFSLLCFITIFSTFLQVPVCSASAIDSGSASKTRVNPLNSKLNTLILDPIIVTGTFETGKKGNRARIDIDEEGASGNDQCFIQGPQGFRQSSLKSSSSNENLTVSVASILDGVDEFGDTYFKYSRDVADSSRNDLESDISFGSNKDTLLFRADLNNETSTSTTSNSTDNDNETAMGTVNLYPCWLDRDLARQGQSFARRYFAQINNAHILSLLLLIVNEQVRRVLAYTMKSNNPERAKKRYLATMLQIKLWYDEDLSSPHLVKSLLKVRNIHRTVGYKLDTEMPDLTQQQTTTSTSTTTTSSSTTTTESTDTVTITSSDNNENSNNNNNNSDNNIESEPTTTPEPPFKPNREMWDAFKKDLSESYLNQTRGNVTGGRKFGKYAYNQFLMSLTQWSFMAIPVLYPHKFVAMQEVTDQDLQGFTHLWAVLSFALGMKEEYIICKNRDLESCREYCKEVLDKYFIPFLFNLDDEAEILLESLLKLATYITPQVPEETILLQLLEDFFGVDCPNLRQYASWQSHFVRKMYQYSQDNARPSGFFSRAINFLFRGQIQVASLQVYGFDGTNPEEVAEKAYYFR